VKDGQLARLAIPNDHTGVGSGPAWVWLPPQYFSEPDRRFPVVYLFHGSPGQPADWSTPAAPRVSLSGWPNTAGRSSRSRH
jgi:hypothetical protein